MKQLLLKLLVAGFLSMSLVNCLGSKVSTANYDKIEEGMSMKKVEKILGKPTKIEGSTFGKSVIWESSHAKIIIQFANDAVSSKEFVKEQPGN